MKTPLDPCNVMGFPSAAKRVSQIQTSQLKLQSCDEGASAEMSFNLSDEA